MVIWGEPSPLPSDATASKHLSACIPAEPSGQSDNQRQINSSGCKQPISGKPVNTGSESSRVRLEQCFSTGDQTLESREGEREREITYHQSSSSSSFIIGFRQKKLLVSQHWLTNIPNMCLRGVLK